MKKVLSLVLAFAMILGSFGFVFASSFPDVKDSEYYGEPVNVLSGLGVIGGFPDGTFGTGKEVTRAEMATMIVNALGMTVTGKADTKFSDVPKTHWASGFINYATSVGFVAGYPDGTFKPEDPVTYDQALTMIVAALGYESDALPGNWPGNFVNKAKGLGILDICATTGNAKAVREDIACFLYKALTAQIGYTDKDGAWHANVDGNGVANDTMIARLGAVPYDGGNGEGKPFVVTGSEPSSINLQNYLGAYITAYASKDDKDEIIAVKEVLSVFIEGEKDDLLDEYKLDGVKATPVTAFTNGDKLAAKKAIDDQAATDVLKVAVKLSGTKATEIYSIQKWEVAGTFEADADIQDDIADKAKLGIYALATDDDDEIVTEAFGLYGVDKIEDIKKGDIVTVYLHQAKNDDIGYKIGDVAKIEVSDKTVDGVISKINKGQTKFTIGGTAYGRNTDGITVSELETLMKDKAEATFKLDYAGKIFAAESEDTSVDNYAVVLATGGTIDKYGAEAPIIKLFTADGTEKEMDVEENLSGTGYDADLIGNYWDAPIDAGTLILYTVEDDVITDIKICNKAANNQVINKSGVITTAAPIQGKAFNADSVIFNYTGADNATAKAKASNYEVLTLADIVKKTLSFKYDIDGGKLPAALVGGLTSEDTELAIFVSKNGTTASGELWDALYDGQVKEFTVKGTTAQGEVAAAQFKLADLPYVWMLELTMDKDGNVTDTDQDTASVVSLYGGIDATKKITLSGSVLSNGDNNFPIADEVVVYTYNKTDDEWSASSSASAMTGKADAHEAVFVKFNSDMEITFAIVIDK